MDGNFAGFKSTIFEENLKMSCRAHSCDKSNIFPVHELSFTGCSHCDSSALFQWNKTSCTCDAMVDRRTHGEVCNRDREEYSRKCLALILAWASCSGHASHEYDFLL